MKGGFEVGGVNALSEFDYSAVVALLNGDDLVSLGGESEEGIGD